jgi:hypothetical protein
MAVARPMVKITERKFLRNMKVITCCLDGPPGCGGFLRLR